MDSILKAVRAIAASMYPMMSRIPGTAEVKYNMNATIIPLGRLVMIFFCEKEGGGKEYLEKTFLFPRWRYPEREKRESRL